MRTYAHIRQGLVPGFPAEPPTNNVRMAWTVRSPAPVGTSTAAGYYLARTSKTAACLCRLQVDYTVAYGPAVMEGHIRG